MSAVGYGSKICIENPLGADVQMGFRTSTSVAFTVQRTLCTCGGNGHPVQKARPAPWALTEKDPNYLKIEKAPKFIQSSPKPRGAGFRPLRPKLGPNLRIASE